MRMARLAASPSTCGGRDSGCASGPVRPLGEEFLLQVEDQFAVLRVHRRHRAQLQAALEAGHQGIVGGPDGVLVGHEVLEAVHPVLCHQLAHFPGDLVAPPGDGDVEAVVRSDFCAQPRQVWKASSSDCRGLGMTKSMIEVVPPASPAAVPLKKSSLATVPMKGNCMWVWGSMPPASGTGHRRRGRRSRRGFEVLADGLDEAVGTEHVGSITLFVSNHGGATDQQGHAVFPRRLTGRCRFLKLFFAMRRGLCNPVSADRIRI